MNKDSVSENINKSSNVNQETAEICHILMVCSDTANQAPGEGEGALKYQNVEGGRRIFRVYLCFQWYFSKCKI